MAGPAWYPPPAVLLWAVCLSLTLPGSFYVAQGSIYHHTGICVSKDRQFMPGQIFTRGCDKCFCHHYGFVCTSPVKPTSWPEECQRVPTECGYRVVYRGNPELDCRVYSVIG